MHDLALQGNELSFFNAVFFSLLLIFFSKIALAINLEDAEKIEFGRLFLELHRQDKQQSPKF